MTIVRSKQRVNWITETCPRCKSDVKMADTDRVALPDNCPNCRERTLDQLEPAADNTVVVNATTVQALTRVQANDSARITALSAEVTLLRSTLTSLLQKLGVKAADIGAPEFDAPSE